MIRKGAIVNKAGVQSLRSALISLKRDAAHVPLLGEAAAHDDAIAAKKKLRVFGKPEAHELHTAKAYKIAPGNWDLLEKRYNVNREEIELYLREYKAKVTNVPGLLTSQLVERLARIDE